MFVKENVVFERLFLTLCEAVLSPDPDAVERPFSALHDHDTTTAWPLGDFHPDCLLSSPGNEQHANYAVLLKRARSKKD